MKATVFVFILGSVALSAGAQVILKWGMSGAAVQRALEAGSLPNTLLAIAGSGGVLLGLSMYFASALVWLFVLARVDVSYAYPFVGLGFVLTMLSGWLILGEDVGILRIVGTLLVAAGVVLIART
jgi:multidrug transporter EmrE-like cation transporter